MFNNANRKEKIKAALRAREELSRILGAGTEREYVPEGAHEVRMEEEQVVWSWERIISETAKYVQYRNSNKKND